MSTIYSDAAGNKYLGDCRWGNHDINYPTTNWLKSVDGYTTTSFFSDVGNLLTTAGFTSVNTITDWPTVGLSSLAAFPNVFTLFSGISSLGRTLGLGACVYGSGYYEGFAPIGLSRTNKSLYASGFGFSEFWGWWKPTVPLDYVMVADQNSFGLLLFASNSSRSGFSYNSSITNPRFFYVGHCLDVNTNFDYYNASSLTKTVILYAKGPTSYTSPITSDAKGSHYISNDEKMLLETGRAIYTIECSDGQTPGAQWATDMWVYDNNATLGYPVIGRVPNMLLGIGNYTYLKPVKIQGSVFPDNGSPWYLPVGTFAEKVLLMRCYSSMP